MPQYIILAGVFELGTSLPLSAMAQTIKLVHFVLRCKAAEFGCITPPLNGLLLNVRETVIGRRYFKFVQGFGEGRPLPCW